jgi:uncharacterized peroxidase-related enzyme
MTTFDLHTPENAPEASRPFLEQAQKSVGFVPNLYATFAESPQLLEAYLSVSKILDQGTFSPTERQIVLLTTSLTNGCDYCMAAHSTIAGMQNVQTDVIASLRDGTPIADARLEALRQFTLQLVENRGWADEAAVDAFLAAGYTKAQVLETILGVGMKTLSNYTNHIASTKLDDAFQPQAWSRPVATK